MVSIVYSCEETDIDSVDTDAKEAESAPTPIEIVTIEYVHIGGIVIEAEHIIPPPQEIEYDIPAEEYTQKYDSSGIPFRNIIIALVFIASVTFAYFLGKKGIAMLGAMKKASCILLILGMMLCLPQTAYAVDLPRYGFGIQNIENTVHFNTSVQTQGNSPAILNFNPSVTSHVDGDSAMHFHPRASNNGARASPYNIFASGGGHAYNYGDTIGVLTVERLNRRINVIAGATMSAMNFGAGHFSFTGLNHGNTGLIGHNRGRSNGFFDFVRHLREGDILILDAGGITRRYSVAVLYTIDDTDFSPLMQFNDNRISLITCLEYRRNQRRVAVGFAID
jgi:LPXTG-site transpeptidase (sortase) family protein